MRGADHALGQLRDRVNEWSAAPDGAHGDFDERFRAALADDLDLPGAMALVSELSRSDLAPGAKARLLIEWDRVLGLDLARAPRRGALPDGAAALLSSREKARAAKDFATADRIRSELAAMGVRVTDTPDGQTWEVGRPVTRK
jgi:cysteinyl-tRNA synthetase